MVKRSLSQSAEEPIFFNWLMILLPYSFFQSQAVFQKLFTADIVFVDAHLFQLVDDLNLCGNSGMVCARLPQCFVALHTS